MKKNVGKIDSIVRLIIAVVALALFVTGTLSGALGYVAIAVAVVMAITGIVGTCPIYMIFGIRTCPLKESKG